MNCAIILSHDYNLPGTSQSAEFALRIPRAEANIFGITG